MLSPSQPDFGNSAETPPQNTETIGSFTLNLRLPGQHFDAETGYHYNGFRDYSPELGRYLQADPIGLNGGMNLYAYCGGDPVNRKDERGLWVVDVEISGKVNLGPFGLEVDLVGATFGTEDGDFAFSIDGPSIENTIGGGLSIGKGIGVTAFSGDFSEYENATTIGVDTPVGTYGVVGDKYGEEWGVTLGGPSIGFGVFGKSPGVTTEYGTVLANSDNITPGGSSDKHKSGNKPDKSFNTQFTGEEEEKMNGNDFGFESEDEGWSDPAAPGTGD